MLDTLTKRDDLGLTESATVASAVNLNDFSLPGESQKIERIFKSFGPGLIAGASDDDPSGIATYSMAGAAFGFATLWTAILLLPLLISVQFMCARIGMVTGSGIGTILRRSYPKAVLYPAIVGLVVANSINAAADISAVASAFNLILPVPVPITTLIVTGAIAAFQFFGSYRLLARIFKWLTLSLFAYVAAAFFIKVDIAQVAYYTFVPTFKFDKDFLSMMVAILGTTLSPYLFFWQADQEIEERMDPKRIDGIQQMACLKRDLSARSWDIRLGMFAALVGMYFIILVTGATLHQSGHTVIVSAADAALALSPLAGRSATILFAIGIIGTGFLAIPILTTSSAYALAQVFGWAHGLDKSFNEAREFYAIILGSMVFGLAIVGFGVNPFIALYWAAVINGVLAAPLLVLLMVIANDRKIMGRYTNGVVSNLLGCTAVTLSFAAIVAMALAFR